MLTGGPFFNSSGTGELLCRIGGEFVVPARYIDSSTVVCEPLNRTPRSPETQLLEMHLTVADPVGLALTLGDVTAEVAADAGKLARIWDAAVAAAAAAGPSGWNALVVAADAPAARRCAHRPNATVGGRRGTLDVPRIDPYTGALVDDETLAAAARRLSHGRPCPTGLMQLAGTPIRANATAAMVKAGVEATGLVSRASVQWLPPLRASRAGAAPAAAEQLLQRVAVPVEGNGSANATASGNETECAPWSALDSLVSVRLDARRLGKHQTGLVSGRLDRGAEGVVFSSDDVLQGLAPEPSRRLASTLAVGLGLDRLVATGPAATLVTHSTTPATTSHRSGALASSRCGAPAPVVRFVDALVAQAEAIFDEPSLARQALQGGGRPLRHTRRFAVTIEELDDDVADRELMDIPDLVVLPEAVARDLFLVADPSANSSSTLDPETGTWAGGELGRNESASMNASSLPGFVALATPGSSLPAFGGWTAIVVGGSAREVRAGTSRTHGGQTAIQVSQNGGMDFEPQVDRASIGLGKGAAALSAPGPSDPLLATSAGVEMVAQASQALRGQSCLVQPLDLASGEELASPSDLLAAAYGPHVPAAEGFGPGSACPAALLAARRVASGVANASASDAQVPGFEAGSDCVPAVAVAAQHRAAAVPTVTWFPDIPAVDVSPGVGLTSGGTVVHVRGNGFYFGLRSPPSQDGRPPVLLLLGNASDPESALLVRNQAALPGGACGADAASSDLTAAAAATVAATWDVSAVAALASTGYAVVSAPSPATAALPVVALPPSQTVALGHRAAGSTVRALGPAWDSAIAARRASQPRTSAILSQAWQGAVNAILGQALGDTAVPRRAQSLPLFDAQANLRLYCKFGADGAEGWRNALESSRAKHVPGEDLGGEGPSGGVLVPATRAINDTHVLCTTPPQLRPGRVGVSVVVLPAEADEGDAWQGMASEPLTRQPALFEYLPTPRLDDITPPYASAFVSNTSIILRGQHFAPTAMLACRFTAMAPGATSRSLASILRSATDQSPAAAARREYVPGDVSATTSWDPVDGTVYHAVEEQAIVEELREQWPTIGDEPALLDGRHVLLPELEAIIDGAQLLAARTSALRRTVAASLYADVVANGSWPTQPASYLAGPTVPQASGFTSPLDQVEDVYATARAAADLGLLQWYVDASSGDNSTAEHIGSDQVHVSRHQGTPPCGLLFASRVELEPSLPAATPGTNAGLLLLNESLALRFPPCKSAFERLATTLDDSATPAAIMNASGLNATGSAFDQLVLSMTGVAEGDSAIAAGRPLATDRFSTEPAGVLVPAGRLDDGELECMPPPLPPGPYAVDVTVDGQHFTRDQRRLMVFPRPRVLSHDPVFGASDDFGTVVTVRGTGFINSTLLSCWFNNVRVPATFINSTALACAAPQQETIVAYGDYNPVPAYNATALGHLGLEWRYVWGFHHQEPDPRTGITRVLPESDPPASIRFLTMPVRIEVSNNGQDYSDNGRLFFYHPSPTVASVTPSSSRSTAPVLLFVRGANFFNSTRLACRIGTETVNAVFVDSTFVICIAPRMAALAGVHGSSRFRFGRHGAFVAPVNQGFGAGTVFVEVTNNGVDFTADRTLFTYLGACPTGHFCPQNAPGEAYRCPRGAFCPGGEQGGQSGNFTTCPRGTYQSLGGQAECRRCPIGYFCPDEGMVVPRICPAGFVCGVTGTERAEQPCPEGHYCLEGTGTTSTTCGNPFQVSPELYPNLNHAEMSTTQRRGHKPEGHNLVIGARDTGCFNNGTSDQGFQASAYPARFFEEAHLLPLDPDTPLVPHRGRFCLDDSCLRLADESDMSVADATFDYSSQTFNVRRPLPCAPGTYCPPGTKSPVIDVRNSTAPQQCFESMHCPEGSSNPRGFGDVPPGFYSTLGVRLPCPVGTFCPAINVTVELPNGVVEQRRQGVVEPLPCRPGTFNTIVGQVQCTDCPIGYICPGFGRIDPAVCPNGFVCSRTALAHPNQICPRGFYCNNGTQTVDPFRNDTSLRPLPCRAGTWCGRGVGFDRVVRNDFKYAQNCTAGFYCPAASTTPVGAGLCPAGFYCPEGTAVPIPTPVGTEASQLGTVQPVNCLPGTYAPTIQTVNCVPCPPGTTCEQEGMSLPEVCKPGTFNGASDRNAPVCQGCPLGRFGKQYSLTDARECFLCPPGVVCPVQAMINPCSFKDLPTPFTATRDNATREECLQRNRGEGEGGSGSPSPERQEFYWGVLEPSLPEFMELDEDGVPFRGPHLEELTDAARGECWNTPQRFGTSLYRRMQDFYGPLYRLVFGENHQGYGYPHDYAGPFGAGTGFIAHSLPPAGQFIPGRNCTPGFYFEDEWHPGTCEADILCQIDARSEAEPCQEGFVCPIATSNVAADGYPCPPGFACDVGTTEDKSLFSPQGQFRHLCPAGFYCPSGTGYLSRFQRPCPANYFCPTGTADPRLGQIANDALLRGLTAAQVNPFEPVVECKRLDGERLPRCISEHDQTCFEAADPTIAKQTTIIQFADGTSGPVNLASVKNSVCARDHKWRTVEDAQRRRVCYCPEMYRLGQEVWRLWKCTGEKVSKVSQASLQARVSTGGPDVLQCTFPASDRYANFEEWNRGSAPLYDPSSGWGYLNGTAVMLPRSMDQVRYFRSCANEVPRDCLKYLTDGWSNAGRTCPQFCSFNEMKAWIDDQFDVESDKKLGGSIPRIDRLVYDLKYVADLIDSVADPARPDLRDDDPYDLGEELNELLAFKPDGDLERWDACQCEDIVRCPNGTVSDIRSEAISDCTAAAEEVLLRVNPVPKDNVWLSDTDLGAELTDKDNPTEGVGVVDLLGLESATLTVNFSHLAVNMTYGIHYRLSAYVDCLPCPPRVTCNRFVDPPVCLEGDPDTCAECCACSRRVLPGWFEGPAVLSNTELEVHNEGPSWTPENHFYPFADNKHTVWQVEFKALRNMRLMIVFELMHGQYVHEFATGLKNSADLSVKTPSRAINYEAFSIERLANLFRDVWTVVSKEFADPISDSSTYRVPEPIPDDYLAPSTAARRRALAQLKRLGFDQEDALQSGDAPIALLHGRILRGSASGPPRLGASTAANGNGAGGDGLLPEVEGLARQLQDPVEAAADAIKQAWTKDGQLHALPVGAVSRSSLQRASRHRRIAVRERMRAVLEAHGRLAPRHPTIGQQVLAHASHPVPDVGGVEGALPRELRLLREQQKRLLGGAPLATEPGRRRLMTVVGPSKLSAEEQVDADAPKQVMPWEQPVKSGRFSRGGFQVGDTFLGRGDLQNRPGDPRGELEPPRYVFLAILNADLFDPDSDDALGMPLNLPEALRLRSENNVVAYRLGLENSLLIGHNADWAAGDRNFARRQQMRNNDSSSVVGAPTAQPIDPEVVTALELLEYSLDLETDEEAVEELEWRISNKNPESAFCESLAEGVDPVFRDLYIDDATDYDRDPTWFDSADPLAEDSVIASIGLPYFPFLSNCENGDSHMWISNVLENNPSCSYKDVDGTRPISEAPWDNQLTARADECELAPEQLCPAQIGERRVVQDTYGIQIRCAYEENIFEPGVQLRWFERGGGDSLWSMTKHPVSASTFEATPHKLWGRGDALDSLVGTDLLMHVLVDADMEAVADQIPRRIILTIGYYQVNKATKRIVDASVGYTDFCTISDRQNDIDRLALQDPPVEHCNADGNRDRRYTLELAMVPLTYISLLNLFEFSALVYIVFFIGIGVVVMLSGVVVYLFSRCVSRLPFPPALRFWTMLRIVTPAPLFGVAVATVPFLILTLFTYSWFFGSVNPDPIGHPDKYRFEGAAEDWAYRGVILEGDILRLHRGRYGSVLQFCGFLVMLLGIRLFIPRGVHDPQYSDSVRVDDVRFEADTYDDRLYEGEAVGGGNGKKGMAVAAVKVTASELWRPYIWKRALAVLLSFLVVLLMAGVLEYSFSDSFVNNQLLFLVVFKISNMFMEMILAEVLRESLLVTPIMVMTSIVELLVTLGAEDFTDFTLAFLIELALNITERILLDPGVKGLLIKLPKWRYQCKRLFRRRRRLRTKAQREADEAEWAGIMESISRETEGTEPILDAYLTYSNSLAALLMAPAVQLFLLMTDTQGIQVTEIPLRYGIRSTDLFFYTIFAVVIIPATLAMDMYLFNAMELIHGWRVYDFLIWQRYRFAVREKRWQMMSPELDTNISGPLQTTDLVCFSSQLYFMMSVTAYGLFILLVGINLHLNVEWNILGDPWTLVLFIICWLIIYALQWACFYLGEFLGLWRLYGVRGFHDALTFDEDLAAAQAEAARKAAEEAEDRRIEAKALNDPVFRHRWLDRNRPWVLSQLAKVITPRQLDRALGPKHEPLRDYVRQVYDSLTGEGPLGNFSRLQKDGRRLPGADDISDPGSDDEAYKPEWMKRPPPPMKPQSMELMRRWLAKARRRRLYAATVQDLIDTATSQLQQTIPPPADGGPPAFKAELALPTGKPHPLALNSYIREYELQYPPNKEPVTQPFNAARWRAYFRGRAKYVIAESDRAANALRRRREAERRAQKEAQGRRTRAEDISDSSDDGDDGPIFPPVVVGPDSAVGATMGKWLGAARRRLGGVFPRPGVTEEVQAYLGDLKKRREAARRRELRKQAKARLEKAKRADPVAASSDGKRALPQLEEGRPALPKPELNAASVALAQRWLYEARDHRLAGTGEDLRDCMDRLQAILGPELNEATDWYYSSTTRARGEALLERGQQLVAQRHEDEADAQMEGANKLEHFDRDVEARREEMQTELAALQRRCETEKADTLSPMIERAALVEDRLKLKYTAIRERMGLPTADLPKFSAAEAGEGEGEGEEGAAAASAIDADEQARVASWEETLEKAASDDRATLIGQRIELLGLRGSVEATRADMDRLAQHRVAELRHKHQKRESAVRSQRQRLSRSADGGRMQAADAARQRERRFVTEARIYLTATERRVAARRLEEQEEMERDLEEERIRRGFM